MVGDLDDYFKTSKKLSSYKMLIFLSKYSGRSSLNFRVEIDFVPAESV